ncbi:MAG: MOSC domain-containing protein [Betaproteobacteria bacterium]|nr:MOSC domain-containing protein [Betaproteobacteria bacterium]
MKIPAGLRELMSTFPFEGRVVWIGVRPATREPMRVMERVEAIAGRGLAGDRTAMKSRPGNARQVTLIQAEHLDAVARLLRRGVVDPSLARRNIVIGGVNLLSLKGHRFQLGGALLEMTGECHPCSLMELQMGEGGYNAMRGHGGINARVIEGGPIAVGDILTAVPDMEAEVTHDA